MNAELLYRQRPEGYLNGFAYDPIGAAMCGECRRVWAAKEGT